MIDPAVRDFLPWLREGLASAITTPDDGKTTDLVHADITVGMSINSSPVTVKVTAYGPGEAYSLDLIHAALGVAPPATFTLHDGFSTWWNAGASRWPWAMVATGLLIGLGSNPTHEVIQAIQAYKQQQATKP
jgi:hypothetical protein